MTDNRRRDLEELLRQQAERLAPPEGMWEEIARRAKRRKWAKAALATAAGVIIAGGAVPAVIAVRHTNGDDASLSADGRIGAAGHVGSPMPITTTQAAALTGFVPESVSFVSSTEGFLWGSVGSSNDGVVARTLDGGGSWAKVAAPAVQDSYRSTRPGDSQIRFASSQVGFVYGSKYFMTVDGAHSWTELSDPGYIDALETRNGNIWALVRKCVTCRKVSLYSASTVSPDLVPVASVTTMYGRPGTSSTAGSDSLAVSKNADGSTRVVVIVGSAGFWLSPDGSKWIPGADPCQALPSGKGRAAQGKPDPIEVQSAVVSISDASDVTAACGYTAPPSTKDPGLALEYKRTYTSSNSGHTWAPTRTSPSTNGWLETFASGTVDSTILGTTRGGAQITRDGGRTWHPVTNVPQGFKLSFVGYIYSDSHIVAVADPDSAQGAFAWSLNGGSTWRLHTFGVAP